MGDFALEAERCIRCGFCNAVCPTSNITQAFAPSKTSRGRLVMVQSILAGEAGFSPLSKGFLDLVELCFGCRRCLAVCPAGILIPQTMWRVRSAARKMGHPRPSWALRLFISEYDRMAPLASRLRPFSNRFIRTTIARQLAQWLVGLDKRAPLPDFRPLRHRPNRAQDEEGFVYFADVFGLFHEGDMVARLLRFLEMLGLRVVVPKQRQAGIPLLEAGLIDEAKRLARSNVETLYRHVEKGRKILTTSPSAYLSLREDYPRLLRTEEARVVAKNTVDAIQLLKQLHREGRIVLEGAGHVAYHSSCFTQATGMSGEIQGLLKTAGYEFSTHLACCGAAGMWGLLRENYDTAREVGQKLFGELEGADIVVSQSETCRLWMTSFIGARLMHPMELLLENAKSRTGASP